MDLYFGLCYRFNLCIFRKFYYVMGVGKIIMNKIDNFLVFGIFSLLRYIEKWIYSYIIV